MGVVPVGSKRVQVTWQRGELLQSPPEESVLPRQLFLVNGVPSFSFLEVLGSNKQTHIEY